jgi:L-malate glycosyltransferase
MVATRTLVPAPSRGAPAACCGSSVLPGPLHRRTVMKLNVRARSSLFAPRPVPARGAMYSFRRKGSPSLRRADPPSDMRSLTDRMLRSPRDSRSVLSSLLAYAVVACTYLGTLLVCRISRLAPRRPWTPTRRIVATATFFNTQWFLSHVIPLTRSGVDEVIVVTDQPLEALDKVRFWCPPPAMSHSIGRAVSKFVWLLACGFYLKPDVLIGFHLFPGAISALIVARVFGRPACYQMTGGPTEVVGGGAYSENRLLAKLGRPSRLLESLALAVVREFDLVIVRGNKAKTFLTDRGVQPVTVITGSVTFSRQPAAPEREYDLVFVGRLAAIKQPLQFVDIVASLRGKLPIVRAAVVGDGPLLNAVRERAIALGIEQSIDFLGQIQDVERILTRSKVFVLTSQSEGLSIAMAEAMAAGVVPVVADVGDLGDLVMDGVTGFLVTPDNIPEFTCRAALLLQDRELWGRQSRAAAAAAKRQTSVEVVSAKWTLSLSKLVAAYAHPSSAAEDES